MTKTSRALAVLLLAALASLSACASTSSGKRFGDTNFGPKPGGGGSGLTPIANNTLLGNTSGSSATPTAQTQAALISAGILMNPASVAFTGGTIANVAITASTIDLSVGTSGGRTLVGGTGSAENLTLRANSNGLNGKIVLGSTTGWVYTESTGVTTSGIATAASNTLLHIKSRGSVATGGSRIYVQQSSDSIDAAYVTLGSTDTISGAARGNIALYGPSYSPSGIFVPGTWENAVMGGTGNMLYSIYANSGDHIWQAGSTGGTEVGRITSAGNWRLGIASALSTSATAGFVFVRCSAGPPTGSPTIPTGMMAVTGDCTNHKLYISDTPGSWVVTN